MSWLRHPVLTWACALGLGGFFLYACQHKIADPPDFAKAVNNYKLLPSEYVHVVAIFMPWLELFCGLALVTSLGRRGAALIAGLLLVVFIGAIGYNLYREVPIICGCTLSYEESLSFTDEEKFADMKNVILRDVGLLLLAAQVFLSGCCVRREEKQKVAVAAAPASAEPQEGVPG